MCAGFFLTGDYIRSLAAGEFIYGADIQIAVVEVVFQLGHAAH